MSTASPGLDGAALAPRTRAIAENPALLQRTIALLQTFNAFVRLDELDARCIAAYMREVGYLPGELLFRSGDKNHASHLLLLLEGEVSVDASSPGPFGSVPISVLGAGSVLGEMSLLDGAPRSATCTAISNIRAAGLARRGLERLIDEHPRVAAKLMAGLAQRMAERLRAMAEQLQMYGQINTAVRQDLACAQA